MSDKELCKSYLIICLLIILVFGAFEYLSYNYNKKLNNLDKVYGENNYFDTEIKYTEVNASDFLSDFTTAQVESLKGEKFIFSVQIIDIKLTDKEDYIINTDYCNIRLSHKNDLLSYSKDDKILIEAVFDSYDSKAKKIYHFKDGTIIKDLKINFLNPF
ncbi:MAG: hypothetical protein ACOCRX_05325 [Candidatus Woesearchaeota archaeon]